MERFKEIPSIFRKALPPLALERRSDNNVNGLNRI